jgi:hypothetical protein
MAAYERVTRAWRNAADEGMSGTSDEKREPLACRMRPELVMINASWTPARSRSSCSRSAHCSVGVASSSAAALRVLALRSTSIESSVVRPRVNPESSARSIGTSNHDSIERPRNCTATT